MKETNEPQPLTLKEKSVLTFIEEHILNHGISPSFNEIKDHFSFASLNSVQNYIKQLQGKGYLSLPKENQKRALQLIHNSSAFQEKTQKISNQKLNSDHRPSPSLVKKSSESLPTELLQNSPGEILSIPLLGKVAAGLPLEAFAHDEYMEVPSTLVRNPSKTFALKVKGQSMIEDGILDGDIILVQKQSVANTGEIIVAIIDNEATVKRFYTKYEPKTHTKTIELRPSNSQMQSMWFKPNEVEIRGVVVGLLRKY